MTQADGPPLLLSESAIGERLTRVRVLRRPAHPGRRRRTDSGLLADLPPDAGDGAPGPRLAVRVTGPGPGAARPAPAGHRPAPAGTRLNALFRESPEAARHLCTLLGTSPLFAGGYERHPEQLALLESGRPRWRPGRSWSAGPWRAWPGGTTPEWWRGLTSLQRSELLRAQARDVLGREDVAATGRSLARLAEAVLEVALGAVAGGDGTDGLSLPIRKGLAVMAMGRFGGAELAYASDLDVLVVFDDDQIDAEEAEEIAEALLRLLSGETPVQGLYELDMSLRPEGRKGSLARSLKAYEGYYERWAQVWERQALTRGRFVAGDPDVGRRFGELARVFLWGAPAI